MKEKIIKVFAWVLALFVVWIIVLGVLGVLLGLINVLKYTFQFAENQQLMTGLQESCDGEIMLVQWKYGCFIGGEQTSCQVLQCVQTNIK